MNLTSKIQKISESPTRPVPKTESKKFDVANFYEGPLKGNSTSEEQSETNISLQEKLRQAYFWIVNNAIISPYYDIEYNDGPNTRFTIGDLKSKITLPSADSYSSFILMPLLNLITRRRCLIVGGPGRGKTASAMLMAIIAGYSLKEIKRAIQHGQPQMTISDLLGNPIPSDLMTAKSMDDIKISWRKWLGMRVKIIDEYNRIPTRTQSALLTVLGDNYAEILDQIYECPEAAWYLTANDDAGGGTYQVIEALKDRIDIVVKALHFNSRFIGDLLGRIESGIKPEENVPKGIIFSEAEIDTMNQEILEIEFPKALLRRIEYFASHFEFYEPASEQIEYKTKDTVKLSGVDFRSLDSLETGKDKIKDIGNQTRNGLSVRSITTCLVFIKALTYFRGEKIVRLEDVEHILPFVLHDKLIQNVDAIFFQQPENAVYRVDKISWIKKMFELSCNEFNRLSLDTKDPISEIESTFEKGLEGVNLKEAETEIQKIEKLLSEWSGSRKLYGNIFDDILKLKYLHQRYTNYIRWLKTK
jgi:MoxR-like ATPase